MKAPYPLPYPIRDLSRVRVVKVMLTAEGNHGAFGESRARSIVTAKAAEGYLEMIGEVTKL